MLLLVHVNVTFKFFLMSHGRYKIHTCYRKCPEIGFFISNRFNNFVSVSKLRLTSGNATRNYVTKNEENVLNKKILNHNIILYFKKAGEFSDGQGSLRECCD